MTSSIYALLVGIDRFQYAPNLNGCVNDITAVKKFLESCHNEENYNLVTQELLNEAATRKAVIDGFKTHLSRADKGDVVLFYFCGHGSKEKAGDEFKDWENDNVHETIICHDCRSETNGKKILDIADKELRYLISEIANKEDNSPGHILIVFDCCHSGSGTRDLADTDGVRGVDNVANPREYNDFCFADCITAAELSPETFPQGEHTFIAACLNSQTAKEIPISERESKKYGLFTYSLLRELESLNRTLSSQALIQQVRTRVTGVRLYQNPQLESVKGIDTANLSQTHSKNSEQLAFLGDPAIIKPRNPSFTLRHRPYVSDTETDPEQQKEWIINAGAFTGIQKDMELAVYPEDSKYKDFQIEEDQTGKTIQKGFIEPIAQIKITQVRASESVVEFVSGELAENSRDRIEEFPTVVIKRPVPKVRFYFEAEKEADRELLEKVKKLLGRSLFVGVTEDCQQAHQYRLDVHQGQFKIKDIDNRLLIEPFPAENNDDSIALAAERIEHIAKWVIYKNLENLNSSINKDDVEIEVTYQGVTSKESHLDLFYELEKPKIGVKIKNKSDSTLYFTLLDICGDYSIEIAQILYDGENEANWLQIEAGDTYTAKYRGKNEFSIGIPKGTNYEKLTEYKETLKLIASTHPFPVEQFELNPLPITSSQERQIGSDEEKPTVGDWITKQFSFKFIRPQSSVEIDSNTPTKLTEGISLQVPAGFSATASLKSLSASESGERSLAAGIKIPLSKNAEAFDLIDRSTSDRSIGRIPQQQLNVLELSGSNLATDRITPETPIVISSNRPLEANESVLAIADDGNFWLPVGYGIQENGKTKIKVERLIKQGGSEERDARESMSLCLLKIAGLSKQTTWLRVVEFNSNDTVSYTAKGDTKSVKEAVAQAERIVLFIHGILGDTETMSQSVRDAQLLNLNGSQDKGKYDLVLAFDYENLNTEIQQTAEILKQRLKEVGLGEGHNKTLHIIAHSMGGLVSRWFIEQAGGNKIVSHLIMLGTPNGGSEWSSVYHLATTLLTVGLNFIPKSFVAAPIVSFLVKKGSEEMSKTLQQMHIHKSDLLPQLRKSNDPQCPYTIIAGDTRLDRELNKKADNLLQALKQKVWQRAEFPFKGENNDIAVTVESIFTKEVFEGRNPPVNFIDPIACNHLEYFKDRDGLNTLTQAVLQAFE